jgi:hypothetical protein
MKSTDPLSIAFNLLRFLSASRQFQESYLQTAPSGIWGIELPDGYCEREAGLSLLWVAGSELFWPELVDRDTPQRAVELLLRIRAVLRVVTEYGVDIVIHVLRTEKEDENTTWEGAFWRLLRDIATECLQVLGEDASSPAASFEQVLLHAGARRKC